MVSQVINQGSSETEVVWEPKQVPHSVGGVGPTNTGALLVRSMPGPTTGHRLVRDRSTEQSRSGRNESACVRSPNTRG